jgi:branched-chain amino acid transport system permease protein
MVGAYIAYFVAMWLLGLGTGMNPALALAITVPATMLLTALVGVALERTMYRPLRRKGADRLYVVITALMAGLILENGNLALLGASRKRFPDLIDKVIWNFGPVSVTNLKVIVIVAAIAVFLLLQFIVTKTKIGMAMRGISYDKFAIPLMGIPLDTIIVFTFILGSGMAGLAGILFAMSYPILEPYMGALIGWKAFIAAVVGGIGDIRGAIVGGFLLGFIELGVVAFFPSTLRDLFAFSILLAILWLKPTGLFGVAKTTKI